MTEESKGDPGNSEAKHPEIEKLEATASYVELFFARVLSIITHPFAYFKKVGTSSKPLGIETWLFALLSITASSLMFEIIAEQIHKKTAFLATYAITLLCWVSYGLFAHLVCKIARGKAIIQTSISGVLQILSLTTLISMLVALITTNLKDDAIIGMVFYAFVECLLTSFYFGIALGAIHGFGKIRMAIIGIFLGIVFTGLSCILFIIAFLVGKGPFSVSPT